MAIFICQPNVYRFPRWPFSPQAAQIQLGFQPSSVRIFCGISSNSEAHFVSSSFPYLNYSSLFISATSQAILTIHYAVRNSSCYDIVVWMVFAHYHCHGLNIIPQIPNLFWRNIPRVSLVHRPILFCDVLCDFSCNKFNHPTFWSWLKRICWNMHSISLRICLCSLMGIGFCYCIGRHRF